MYKQIFLKKVFFPQKLSKKLFFAKIIKIIKIFMQLKLPFPSKDLFIVHLPLQKESIFWIDPISLHWNKLYNRQQKNIAGFDACYFAFNAIPIGLKILTH